MKIERCCSRELIKFETWSRIKNLGDKQMLRLTLVPSLDLVGAFDLEIETFDEVKK
jgi:hypothetical protein